MEPTFEKGYFPTISWEMFNNKDDTLLNKELINGAAIGGLYLEMPERCKEVAKAALDWCKAFPTDEKRKAFKSEKPREGYSVQKKNDQYIFQYTTFMLFENNWNVLPTDECREFAQLNKTTSVDLLNKVLKIFDINEKDRDRVTIGATKGEGRNRYNANYYDPKLKGPNSEELPGFMAHTDGGFITLLTCFEDDGAQTSGLIAEVETGKWIDVVPKVNHFFVNFGDALAILINDPSRLKAVKHNVTSVSLDRYSAPFFLEPGDKESMYTRDPETKEFKQTGITFPQFLVEKAGKLGFILKKE